MNTQSISRRQLAEVASAASDVPQIIGRMLRSRFRRLVARRFVIALIIGLGSDSLPHGLAAKPLSPAEPESSAKNLAE